MIKNNQYVVDRLYTDIVTTPIVNEDGTTVVYNNVSGGLTAEQISKLANIQAGTKWTQDNTKISNWDTAYTKVQTFDSILSHFSIVNNKLQIDIDTYSTGELSAYGAGAGSGGSILELKQLVDVTDTLSPVDKDLLYYDGTLGMWTTKASSSLDVDLTEITAKIPNWDIAYANTHTHANKAILDAITSISAPAINHLFITGSGTVEDPYYLYTDIGFYSEKSISAYGINSSVGSGGGLIQKYMV